MFTMGSKVTIVSTQEYLFACCRYVELNPFRAGMVDDPGLYKWSSYACKARGGVDKVVDFDNQYMALGNTEKERHAVYEEYVKDTIPEFELKLIREAIQRCQLNGSEQFREQIFKKLGVRISNRRHWPSYLDA